jgi:hypothetical protein
VIVIPFLDNDLPLAFSTSVIIFCILSSSYGKVEAFEVIISKQSILEGFIAIEPETNRLTYATMYQYSHEFIVNIRWKTATLKDDWVE